ncbi:hypothetical protein [Streptomyces sp. NPDC050560]|uniref:hypothetical protein n=1 Tax=Streptomyces sp. NPDC050560 TaxID=3365630 RepID=UPI0037A7CEB1
MVTTHLVSTPPYPVVGAPLVARAVAVLLAALVRRTPDHGHCGEEFPSPVA